MKGECSMTAMEKSDDVQEHFYGFGMEGAMTSLAIYLNA